MSEARSILGPGGNRVKVTEETVTPKKEGLKKPLHSKPAVSEISSQAVRKNVSVDSLCSVKSNSSCSSGKKGAADKRKVKQNELSSGKAVLVLPAKVVSPPEYTNPVKRCDWITPNSEQVYTRFHDEEWGVPVKDDKKLFEVLVLSQALGELSWLEILNKRELFRKLFDSFDPSSIAKFTDAKLKSLKVLLSEQKIRAVVENAKQTLQIQKDFGSFSNYCWSFFNHKPLRNGFRYARNVPVKTPRAELMSKDLMRRGFRCVGPTVIYSFLQVAGFVNDHLVTCFRYQQCNNNNTSAPDKEALLALPDEATGATCLNFPPVSLG